MNNSSPSAALPIARAALRFLVVVNWLAGLGIVVLLVLMPTTQWIKIALKLPPASDDPVIIGLQAVAFLGLLTIPMNYAILKRLLAMVDTVRSGDPFVADNAERLQTIAWLLLALQVIGMIIGMIGRLISTPEHPIRLTAGFSVNGWLAVLLTFLLARVFAEGATMRDDLEGTV